MKSVTARLILSGIPASIFSGESIEEDIMGTTPIVVVKVNQLDRIVSFMEAGAEWAELLLPDGSPPDLIARAAAGLLRIAKATIRARERITGAPIDLNELRELPHV